MIALGIAGNPQFQNVCMVRGEVASILTLAIDISLLGFFTDQPEKDQNGADAADGPRNASDSTHQFHRIG